MILCINKFRDNSGRIVGYRLEDRQSMSMQDVEADFLKDRIKRGMVRVDNLKLTSDGKLVDCNPYGKPDSENKFMVEAFKNGRRFSTTYLDDNTTDEQMRQELAKYSDNIETKVTNVSMSNIKPVKEIPVIRFNKDGTYESRGILGLMNMMTTKRNMKIKGLE